MRGGGRILAKPLRRVRNQSIMVDWNPWTRLLVPKAVQVGVSSIFLVRKWSPGPRQGLIEPRIAAAPINQASSFDSARSSTQPNLEVFGDYV